MKPAQSRNLTEVTVKYTLLWILKKTDKKKKKENVENKRTEDMLMFVLSEEKKI